MYEVLVKGHTLPEAYHKAICALDTFGVITDCEYQTETCKQKEVSMTMVVEEPFAEPMISRLWVGGAYDLERYRQEMLDGALDCMIGHGWDYTYHDRMVNFEGIDQIEFVIDELRRCGYSRRAAVSIRSKDDMTTEAADPACFAAGTLIETPNGRKKVEEIKDGDEVYAYEFNGNTKVVAKVYNCFSKKSNSVAITTDFGNIVVSNNQLMYTTNGWKEAKDLTCNDKIFYNGYSNGKYNIYHLIGCMYGDGWLSSPNPHYHKDGSSNEVRKTIGFSVHPKADTSIVNELFKSFTNNSINYRSNFVKSETVPNGGISKKMEITDVALYDTLSKYVPCGKKTNAEIKISAKEMTVSDIVAFLTGIYSCEGSISKRGGRGYSIQIGMNWHNCIDLIDEMLTILNIPHATYRDKETWKIYIQNYDGMVAFFNSGIDFRFDSRKQIKFENIKTEYEIMKRYGIKNIVNLDTEIEENSMFVPVRSITDCGEMTVYDFTVDHDDHAIVANGFVAHNCLQHIQFFIRDNKLYCKVLFRSNDATEATFMNAWALIMIQKHIADELGVEMGSYTHRANSFHCYEKDFELLEGYVKRINEGNNLTFDYVDEFDEMMEEERPNVETLFNQIKSKIN